MRALKYILLPLWGALLCACPPKLDSPFFDKDYLSVRAWNVKNGHAIEQMNKKAYRIAIVADSHSNYQPLLDVVMAINATPGIDFVVHLGDFTDRALPVEFSYFMEIWGQLKIPSLVILGNHDAIGFGPRIYGRMFGPANYTVTTGGWLQLILLNANTLETGPIDYPWLEKQLAADPEKIRSRIIFRHTNFDNRVHHTEKDSDQFLGLVEQYNVNMVINGHRHSEATHSYPHWVAHQVSRVEGEKFSIINVSEEEVGVKNCRKGGCYDAEVKAVVN